MMTVNLQLVGLAIVVTLDHLSSMVNIFSVLMPYVFQENRRSFWILCNFLKILFEVIHKISIPLVLEVELVIDNYSESLRIFGLIY